MKRFTLLVLLCLWNFPSFSADKTLIFYSPPIFKNKVKLLKTIKSDDAHSFSQSRSISGLENNIENQMNLIESNIFVASHLKFGLHCTYGDNCQISGYGVNGFAYQVPELIPLIQKFKEFVKKWEN